MPFEERIKSSESTAEDLQALILDFNKASIKATHLKAEKMKAGYAADFAEKAANEEQSKVKKNYLDKATSFLNDRVLKNINWANEDIFKAKFAGKFQEETQNALLFLSVNKNNNAILNALDNAIASGALGYAAALVENILIDFKDPSLKNKKDAEIYASSPLEKQQLTDSVVKVREDLFNRLGVANLSKAIRNYSAIKDELEGFIIALNNGAAYHIPEAILRNMEQRTVNELLPFIQESMKYYKNSDRFAGYKQRSDDKLRAMATMHEVTLMEMK